MLSEYDVIEPDLVFISREREKTVAEDNVRGAPDLVVEILSPSSAEMDRKTKLRLYEKYGVREYWLITTEAENVQVFVLRGDNYELLGNYSDTQEVRSEVLKGLAFYESEVFDM